MAGPLDRRLEAATGSLFAPLGLALPLRIEQCGMDEFAADPALASFTLRSAQAVLEADAIAAAFDASAEALDGGRLESTLALTRRLVEEIGERTAMLGALAGPATLAGCGAAAAETSRLATAAVDGLCGAGVSALVLLEAVADPDPGLFGAYDAAFNLAGYYQVPVLYLARHPLAPDTARAARRAGARWAVGPGDEDGGVASVPVELFDGDGAAAATWAAGLPAGVRLYVSAWELPADMPVESVAALRGALCS